MSRNYETRLKGMECFSSLFPDASKEVNDVVASYEVRLQKFKDTGDEVGLYDEMMERITKITDKAMNPPAEIKELRDLYLYWLLDKEIEITPVVAEIIELNVVPLVLRGIIKERHSDGNENLMNNLYYAEPLDDGTERLVSLKAAQGKSFSFFNQRLVVYHE